MDDGPPVAGRFRDRAWRRHDLLRIAPEAWRPALDLHPDIVVTPLLADWATRGWPVILRRASACDAAGLVPVGVPLPPEAGKLRIALAVPEASVVASAAPSAMADMTVAAPHAWRPTIDALVALGDGHGVQPRAFGSLLWQHLTGLAYLTPQSDLDTLWPVAAGCDIAALLAGIAAIEETALMRLDGEIMLPDGRAVNWRELWTELRRDHPGAVLVKTIDGVAMQDLSTLPFHVGAR